MAVKFLRFNLTIFFTLLVLSTANAATRVWDGGGANNSWGTAANWQGDIAPVAGDDLVFPATAAQFSTNNNLGLITFNSIQITGGDYTMSSGFSATSIGAGGVTVETGTQTFNMLISLSAAATFTAVQPAAVVSVLGVSTNGNTLTLDGNGQQGFGLISGAGGVVKQGLGVALFAGPNTYSGTTTIAGGILVVDGNQPNSPINITGGALGGTGTVGTVSITAGGISSGSVSSPTGTLNTRGLTLNGENAATIIKFAGNTAGTYDQINVTGTVNLTGGRLVPVPLNNFNPAVGDQFTIINNDGNDPVIGTFASIAENSVFVAPNGLAFRISYQGGSGNDVVITRIAYAPFDFDGDGKTDVSVFRPSNGTWYVSGSSAGFFARQFGTAEDKIVPKDFDGDGRADIAVYRPSAGSWFILQSSTNAFRAVQFGIAEDTPTPADFDGDGRTDIAVFRPSNGSWYVLRSSNGGFFAEQFGSGGDKPVPADYDSDARADLAVFRPSNGTWYVRSSLVGSLVATQFGANGDLATPADFDGDGVTDLAVYRRANGSSSNFFILNSSDGSFRTVNFGISEDIPTLADFDGDRKTDIGVFRPSNGTWYWLQSTDNGFRAQQFGNNGDAPTSSAFVR